MPSSPSPNDVQRPFPEAWVPHTQLLLDSFHRWLNRDLIARTGSPQADAVALFEAPVIVVSHACEADPLLNYGNRAALNVWEMEISTLLSTPSRLTAQPVHRDERARLLARTAAQGYVDDYAGIRISQSGRRFRIHRAIVWNVVDQDDRYRGQAATFSEWIPVVDGTDS